MLPPYRRRLPILALVLLAVVGCAGGDKQPRARQVAEGYLEAVKAKDSGKAMAFFSNTYVESRGPTGWKADFRLITSRLGRLRSFSLKSSTRRTNLVPPESGTYVTLEYEVEYVKHTATETFVVFKPLARGEYKIVGHTIASEGLFGK